MTTANATVIISDIHLKSGLEQEIPGAPTSLSPLSFSTALAPSEIVFTEDTARIFIGHSPISTDINYKRTSFPYQNIEILTETSPRTKEIVNNYLKSQDNTSFYLPTTIPHNASFSNIIYPEYEGNTVPSKLYGSNSSVTIDYHIFDINNVAIKQGTLQCLLSSNGHTIHEDFVQSVNPSFDFQVNPILETDQYGQYYYLQGKNHLTSNVKLYIRKVTVVSISA